ncbi:MAG: Rpn family recombination-promoting nuclease/putative transposase [Chlamydiales bacterium]
MHNPSRKGEKYMSRYLNPTNDIAFKKLFGTVEHEPLLISFLNAILGLENKRKIKKIELLPLEQQPDIKEGKTSILDVKCTDERGFQYVVEMQNKQVSGFLKRSQYYAAHTYVTQALKGMKHLELKPVILLAIANYNLFSNKDAVVSYHKTLDMNTYENDLEDLSYVFVELPKFSKKEDELVTVQDKWIYFFKNWHECNEVPATIDEPELIEAFRSMEEYNWTAAEMDIYIKMNIALTERDATMEEKFEKGLEKGREEGREEGRMEERRKNAKAMLALGVLRDQVKKIMSLTDEDLEDL